jgi:hypothetical protein
MWLPTIPPPLLGLLFGSGGTPFRICYVLAIAFLFAYCLILRNRPLVLVAGFLIWLTIERLVVATMTDSLDQDTLRWLLAYKEFFFPFLLAVELPRLRIAWRSARPAVRFLDVCAVLFCALVTLAFVVGSAPLDDRLTYARRFAELPLISLAGRLLPVGAAQVRTIAAFMVAIAVPVAIFGFLEITVLEGLVWRDVVPAVSYYHLSTLAGLSAPASDWDFNGLPILFWDYSFSTAIRRLVSTFLEATTLAAFLAFTTALALSFWQRRKLAYAVAGVLGLATCLTLGKAGIVVLVGAGGYALVAAFWPALRRRVVVVVAGVAVVAGIFALVGIAIAANFTNGSLDHVRGFTEGLRSAAATPFGKGLGIGGNFGEVHTAAESSVGVILLQIGLPGALLWSLWLVGLAMVCADSGKAAGMHLAGLTLGIALLAFFATAVFTESAGGLLGNWPYALVPAMLVGLLSGVAPPVAPPSGRDGQVPAS